MILSIYKDFGFQDVHIKLSTRPENRIGSDESWDLSEAALKTALDRARMDYTTLRVKGHFMDQNWSMSYAMQLVATGNVEHFK